MNMPLDDRGGSVRTNMNLRKIEQQKFMRATSDALQIFGLVFNRTIGVRVREIIRFTAVHGSDIATQFSSIAFLVHFEHFLVGLGLGLNLLTRLGFERAMPKFCGKTNLNKYGCQEPSIRRTHRTVVGYPWMNSALRRS